MQIRKNWGGGGGGGGGGGENTPPNIATDLSMPLMHLSHHLTLYKSRGSKGNFFTSALSLESSLLSCSTPKIFSEGAV